MDSKKDQPKHWYSPDPYFGFRVTYRYEEIDKELAHRRQMAEIAAVPNFVKNVCRCDVCGANVDREYSILVCQNNPAHIGDSGTGIITDHSYPKSKR